jgi:hypothetical protein
MPAWTRRLGARPFVHLTTAPLPANASARIEVPPFPFAVAMGLLKHLLFWPVTGPTFLARFSLDKVQDTVRGELTDDERIKEDLLALQMELELGEIDDDEYVAREAELMLQLREVRQWREEFGMGVAGGPVRVRADEDRPEPKPGRIAGGGAAEIELGFDEPHD